MTFSKIRFGKDMIFTTVVQDLDGKELARWRCNKKDFPKAVNILSKQFGLNVKIIDKNQRKDLEWIN